MRLNIYAVKPAHHPFPLFSWLIRLVQGTKYSHMASVCEYDARVLDATGHGTNLTNRMEFFDRYKVVKKWDIDVPNVSIDKWVTWIASQEGKEYSYWQNFGYILKAFGFKKNPFGRENKEIVCSELQALQIGLSGRYIGDSDEYDLIKTEELLDEIKKEQEANV